MTRSIDPFQFLLIAVSGWMNQHHHTERNHQRLEDALLCPDPGHAVIEGKVHRRERVGGLLNYYYRKAA